jgi:hypothetical protein
VSEVTRKCFGCELLSKFKARPDEQSRYGFGKTGYGCKQPGYEGYVDPLRPICIRGPFLKARASTGGDA